MTRATIISTICKQIGFAIISLLLPSCIYTDKESGCEAESFNVKVNLREDIMTKSSFNWTESEIKDIQLFIAQADGTISETIYSEEADNLSFTGTSGTVYKVMAAANVGRKLEVSNLADFSSMNLKVDCSGISSHGVPMFTDSIEEITIKKGTNEITLYLTRMLARVDLILDKSRLEAENGFKIKSVEIYNAVSSYQPFSSCVKQTGKVTDDYSFDYASANDLYALNDGRKISLYAFENMQGTILPGNTDPWKKVPSNLYDKAGLCSYLEIECSYTGKEDYSDDITYRMYLGKDTCTNFDIARNSVYEIVFIPTEEEIYGNRGSWKIESHGWHSILPETVTVTQYRMSVSPKQISLSNEETAQLYAFIEYRTGTRHATEEDSSINNWSSWTRLYEVTDDSGTFWESSSSGTASVYRGLVTAGSSNGKAYITATCFLDGRELSDYSTVNVSSVPSKLFLEMAPESIMVGEQSYGSVTVQYSDGTIRSVSNNECIWSADRCGSVNKGTFTASEPGTATITCTYQGLAASGEVNVQKKPDAINRWIEITPSISYLSEGEETVLSAMMITSINGVECERLNITGDAAWGTASGQEYVSCDGNGHYSWKNGAGESTVTATYFHDGKSLTGEAKIVSAEPIYLVSIHPAANSITLDHSNYWSESVSITALYSNGATKDITSECTMTDLTFTETANGWVTAVGEGQGMLDCSYTFRGITKTVQIEVKSIEQWMTEGIHCNVTSSGNTHTISDIVASKISPFRHDSMNVPLSKNEYSYSFSNGTNHEETDDGFIIHGDGEMTVEYTCPVTGDTVSFSIIIEHGVCTNISE